MFCNSTSNRYIDTVDIPNTNSANFVVANNFLPQGPIPDKPLKNIIPGLTPVSWRDESLGSGSLGLRHVVLRFRGILWFGPRRSHSSVPTRALTRLPRAVAVKDGRFLRPPEGLVLDGREHGGRLVCVAIDGCCMMPVFVVNR